jgi:hypothetical protein
VIEAIGNQLVTGVNWPGVFYFVLVVFMMIVVLKCFDSSPADIAGFLIREFGDLLERVPNRGAMNAVALVFIFTVIIFYLFIDPVRILIEIAHSVQHGAHQGPPYLFIASMFCLFVFGLISVFSLKR